MFGLATTIGQTNGNWRQALERDRNSGGIEKGRVEQRYAPVPADGTGRRRTIRSEKNMRTPLIRQSNSTAARPIQRRHRGLVAGEFLVMVVSPIGDIDPPEIGPSLVALPKHAKPQGAAKKGDSKTPEVPLLPLQAGPALPATLIAGFGKIPKLWGDLGKLKGSTNRACNFA